MYVNVNGLISVFSYISQAVKTKLMKKQSFSIPTYSKQR